MNNNSIDLITVKKAASTVLYAVSHLVVTNGRRTGNWSHEFTDELTVDLLLHERLFDIENAPDHDTVTRLMSEYGFLRAFITILGDGVVIHQEFDVVHEKYLSL